MSLWLFCIYSNSNGWINHLHWFLSIVCTDFFNILIFSLLSPKPGCSVVCFYCLYSLGCWSHLPGSLLCAWTFMKGPQSLRIIPFISKGLYFLPCNMKNKGMIPSMKAEIELGWGWVGFQGFWKTWFSSGLSLSFECGLSQLWILTVLPCRGCILVLPPVATCSFKIWQMSWAGDLFVLDSFFLVGLYPQSTLRLLEILLCSSGQAPQPSTPSHHSAND